MAVTKDFLKEQMKKLETNYGRDKFNITKDIFNLWLEMFADCKEEVVEVNVIRSIDR